MIAELPTAAGYWAPVAVPPPPNTMSRETAFKFLIVLSICSIGETAVPAVAVVVELELPIRRLK